MHLIEVTRTIRPVTDEDRDAAAELAEGGGRGGEVRIAECTEDHVGAAQGELTAEEGLEIAPPVDGDLRGGTESGACQFLGHPRAQTLAVLVVDVQDEHPAQLGTLEDLLDQERPLDGVIPSEAEHPRSRLGKLPRGGAGDDPRDGGRIEDRGHGQCGVARARPDDHPHGGIAQHLLGPLHGPVDPLRQGVLIEEQPRAGDGVGPLLGDRRLRHLDIPRRPGRVRQADRQRRRPGAARPEHEDQDRKALTR